MTATGADRPADGLFGPESVTWRVNREGVLLAGGGRALLLQVAHPLVAAGVARHSSFRERPWDRLYGTLDLTTRIVFGDAEESARAARRLRSVHSKVRGVAPGGRPYDALDPDLLIWVWATLVESAMLVYRRYVGSLSARRAATYYAEQQRFAHACGVPEGACPPDLPALIEYFERTIASDLEVGEDAREIAESVLRPPLPAPLRPLAAPLNLLTVGLLPPAVRELYGLRWDARREALLDGAGVAVRAALPLLPRVARDFPHARRAWARAGSHGGAAQPPGAATPAARSAGR